MNRENNQRKSVFEVKKKHSWRVNLIRLLEIGLILIVLFGTVVWLLSQSNFSLEKLFQDVKGKLQPKITAKKVISQKDQKQDLQTLLESEKVFEIESINDVQNGLEVKSKNSATVVFAKDKDLSNQVRTLQTLLAKAKIENKSVKRVDFRFEKIVVQY